MIQVLRLIVIAAMIKTKYCTRLYNYFNSYIFKSIAEESICPPGAQMCRAFYHKACQCFHETLLTVQFARKTVPRHPDEKEALPCLPTPRPDPTNASDDVKAIRLSEYQ